MWEAERWQNPNYFYPRPPRGGRQEQRKNTLREANFYPRPPRGGRRGSFDVEADSFGISIHALLAEGDAARSTPSTLRTVFLSTPSSRRATVVNNFTELPIYDFYPRPPRGGRPWRPQHQIQGKVNFYPRPPRGGRPDIRTELDPAGKFLSTPSSRRATTTRPETGNPEKISIHALLAEGDIVFTHRMNGYWPFLSTPSSRRATRGCLRQWLPVAISIHALLAEGDMAGRFLSAQSRKFLSTPSSRRATSGATGAFVCVTDFYPRPPRGGRPVRPYSGRFTSIISIHALLAEGDRRGWTS